MTLDRQRPYGHISGELEGFSGARFYQEGRYFDTNGVELFAATPEKPPKPLKPPKEEIKRPTDPIMELVIGDGEE